MKKILLGTLIFIASNVLAQQINVKIPQINVYAKERNTIDTIDWNGVSEDADLSQTAVLTRQKSAGDVPPGNYSGLVYLNNNQYAVITDEAEHMGYYLFNIDIDDEGQVEHVSNLGWHDLGVKSQDEECIAYNPYNRRFYIGNEGPSTITEVDGDKIVKTKVIDEYAKNGVINWTIESLCFDAKDRCFYTVNEGPLKGDKPYHLGLKKLNEKLKEIKNFDYVIDMPEVPEENPVLIQHAYGVSELCPLLDGTLLALEREIYVRKSKIGSWVRNKVYRFKPGFSRKQLVADWKTKINLTNYSLANYEGMCLGPKLKDGRRVIMLCSDSQNRYKGILKDWFRTIILPN